MNRHRTALLLITLFTSFAAGAVNPAGQTCGDCPPCFRDAAATGTTDTDRSTQRITLPTGQLVVVTEGDFEPRSVGSYSVRLYSAANPRFPMDDFLVGLIHARDGYLDEIVLANIDGDQHKELVVVIRSAGTGGYLSAQAFSIDTSTIVLRSSVAGLADNADPIAALKNALAAD